MVRFNCEDCEESLRGRAGFDGQCPYCGAWNTAPDDDQFTLGQALALLPQTRRYA